MSKPRAICKHNTLIAAMNPCPCRFYGDSLKPCTCSNSTITKYQKRISGPLLDRSDIHIEVPRVEYDKLSDQHLGETSAAIQARVETARQRQRERFNIERLIASGISCNADIRPAEVRLFCQLDETGHSLMRTAISQLQLSARAYRRILKLALTIDNLTGNEAIGPSIWPKRCSTGREELTINHQEGFPAGCIRA